MKKYVKKTGVVIPVFLICILLILCSHSVSAEGSPDVDTVSAIGVSETSAVLQGNLTDDGGLPCTVGFDWGTDTGYGNTVFFSPHEPLDLNAQSASYGGTIRALTIDDTYVYAGGWTTRTVRQYWKSNMTMKAESDSYGGTIWALTSDSDYVYAGGWTTQTVRQYWKSNMTMKAESANYGGTIWALTIDDTYVYAGGDTTRTVRQYWKSNMTYKQQSASYGGDIYALTSDSDYVYAGGVTTQTVQQYWKSNMTMKAESANYGGSIRALTIDDTFVYAGGATTQTVRQYWKSNMTMKAESANYGGTIWALTIDSDYVYAGGGTTQTVRQYWKSNMTMKAESEDYGGTIWALTIDDTYVYAGGTTTQTVRQYWSDYEKFNLPYDFNTSLTDLSPGTTYHFRAWVENSDGRTYGDDMTFTTLMNSTVTSITNIFNTSATLNGKADAVAPNTEMGFYISETLPVNNNNFNFNVSAGNYNQGQTFNYALTGLTPGQIYYVRTWANSTDSFQIGTNTMSFLTRPNKPSDFTIDNVTTSNIDLSWTTGEGADRTVIVRKTGIPPTSVTDGTVVYNDTGTSHNDTLPGFDLYYYGAWSYTTDGGHHMYSSDKATTEEIQGVVLRVYNETTEELLNDWNIFISTQDGSNVFTQEGLDSGQVILDTDMPTGSNVMFHVYKPDFRPRTFYYDIEPGGIIFLDFYLLHRDEAELYLLSVLNPYGEGLEDVQVEVSTFINGSFVPVSITYTSATGQTDVYMEPFNLYKVRLSKEGYATRIVDFTPTDSIFTQTFKLEYFTPDMPIDEYLWDGITWDIQPPGEMHRESIDFVFSITCTNNQLEWYRMRIQYHNTTTDTWETLYDQNHTNPGGGIHEFTSPDIPGRYVLDAWFKKENFSSFQFGASLLPCRNYWLTHDMLTPSLEDVPSSILFLVIMCLAIAGIGVLLKMGARELSGMAGLLIMGVGAMFAPHLMIGMMAFWQVVLVAGIAYFVILYVMGRI